MQVVTTLCADDEPLSLDRLKRLLSARSDLKLCAACPNAEAVFKAVQKHRPHLLILDIRMPGMSGLELASTLNDLPGYNPQIIFVTAHADHAVEAFELTAVDYVLKPYHRERLDKAIDRALKWAGTVTSQSADRFSYRHNGRIRYISFASVESIHAQGKKIVVVVNQNQIPINLSLKRALEVLPSPPFYQVSRSSIVNLDRVLEMEELFNDTAEMHMESGRRVKVSRRGRRALRNQLER